MRAFTVTTKHDEWDALTAECCKRLLLFSGTVVEVVNARDQFDSHVKKLTVPMGQHEDVWFFDSDWWMIREAALPEIPRGGIVATYCRTGHERYLNSCVDKKKVFGTTLWGADMTCPKIKRAFMHALYLQSEYYWNGKPRADESFLNIAVQQAGIPVTFMGFEWNHCAPPNDETIAVHAGAMWPKIEWLRKHCPLLTKEIADEAKNH